MPLQKLAAWLLIIGSVLFLIAAFSPSSRVFALTTPEEKLNHIIGNQLGWLISQVLFALGAILAALGVGILAIYLRSATGPALPVTAIAMLFGAVLWSILMYMRLLDKQGFATGDLPYWYFLVYSLLTQVCLIALGWVLLSTGLPNWSSWMLIGGGALFLILYAIFKDVPPFGYYLLTAVLGILLLRESI